MVRLSSVMRFQKRKPNWFVAWLIKGGDDYRKRLALAYAVSVWSMIGFVLLMSLKDKYKSLNTETVPATHEDPFLNPEKDPSEKRKRQFFSYTEYEEKDLPLTTRAFRFFTPSNKISDSGSTED